MKNLAYKNKQQGTKKDMEKVKHCFALPCLEYYAKAEKYENLFYSQIFRIWSKVTIGYTTLTAYLLPNTSARVVSP